jgi:hypothetical protein
MTQQIKQIEEDMRIYTSDDMWEMYQRRIAEGTFETMSENDQEGYQIYKTIMDKHQEFLNELESFRKAQNFDFGHIWAGSGLSIKKATPMTNGVGTMLDWALVKFPPSRKGTNKVRMLIAHDFLSIADNECLSSKMAGRSS